MHQTGPNLPTPSVTTTTNGTWVFQTAGVLRWTMPIGPVESLFTVWLKWMYEEGKIDQNEYYRRLNNHEGGSNFTMTTHSQGPTLFVTANGNLSAPTYSFTSDPDTGFYSSRKEYPDTLFGAYARWLHEVKKIPRDEIPHLQLGVHDLRLSVGGVTSFTL